MTEDEAKTKWCFAAVASHTNPRQGFETPEQLTDGATFPKVFPCIASACMAWRWSEAKRTEAFHEAVRAHMRTQAKPNAATATQEVYAQRGGDFERTEGACGLAGAPQ
ncbi:hypothetical protein [Synechococcus phage Ssp-JY42]|nr:hypothetical protein [Synechococcus phage Yong-M4-211]